VAKKEIVVDIWKTGAHKAEMGHKKLQEYRAKSNQFTADSDIIGKIDGDSEGYLTIRKKPWEAGKAEQRLILKYFTQKMSYKGTLEEMIGLSHSRTIASGNPLQVCAINLSNHDNLIMLERITRWKGKKKELFTFMMIDEGKLLSYRIEADRFTLGSDWDVYNHHDQKVAKIDGAAFNKFYVD